MVAGVMVGYLFDLASPDQDGFDRDVIRCCR
jgi:hypothetical protein